MNNSIILKNLNLCKNTILYLLAIQIPGNRKQLLESSPKVIQLNSSAGTIFKQVANPNFTYLELKLINLDLVDGVDAFVIGYLAKTIDIGIMNNYQKFIAKNTQIPLMFRSIINNFYVIDGSEILCNIIQNNHYFIRQTAPDSTTLKFGLGSYAALNDYIKFEKNSSFFPKYLHLYLTHKKNIIMSDIEEQLNHEIYNKTIYKNDLFITTLLEINNHNNI